MKLFEQRLEMRVDRNVENNLCFASPNCQTLPGEIHVAPCQSSGLGLTQTSQTQECYKISGVIRICVEFLRANIGNNGFKLLLRWNIPDGLLRFFPFCFNPRKG